MVRLPSQVGLNSTLLLPCSTCPHCWLITDMRLCTAHSCDRAMIQPEQCEREAHTHAHKHSNHFLLYNIYVNLSDSSTSLTSVLSLGVDMVGERPSLSVLFTTVSLVPRRVLSWYLQITIEWIKELIHTSFSSFHHLMSWKPASFSEAMYYQYSKF